MIPNFRVVFGVSKIKIKTLVLIGPLLENFVDIVWCKNRVIFPFSKR